MKLSGNTILITGGSSGIGLALAKAFHELNNKVIITGRDKAKLEQIHDEFPEIDFFPCELTNKIDLDDLVVFIEQKYDSLNLLINNAAVQFNYQISEDENCIYKTDYEIGTNLIVPVKLTALLLPLLLKNKPGAVINISSSLIYAPKKTAPIYCASKAGIHSFTKALRYQLENTGVKVFEIIPPLVDTPMTKGRDKSKISTQQLVTEFIKDFKNDKYESTIGKATLLKWIHRISPLLAERILKNG